MLTTAALEYRIYQREQESRKKKIEKKLQELAVMDNSRFKVIHFPGRESVDGTIEDIYNLLCEVLEINILDEEKPKVLSDLKQALLEN